MLFRNRKKITRIGNVRLQTMHNDGLWVCMIQTRTQFTPGFPGLDVWTDIKLMQPKDTRELAMHDGLDWVRCRLEKIDAASRK